MMLHILSSSHAFMFDLCVVVMLYCKSRRGMMRNKFPHEILRLALLLSPQTREPRGFLSILGELVCWLCRL